MINKHIFDAIFHPEADKKAIDKTRAVKHYTEQARLAKELNQSQQWDATMTTFTVSIWIANCKDVALGKDARLEMTEFDMSNSNDWAKLESLSFDRSYAPSVVTAIATEKVNKVSLAALLHEREELDGRIASMEAMDNE